jgi:UDP-N-acetylmuramyl pentapeptide phosphotransferase/UDP-N-acetylglucosamine-1-phosphate transferase
MDFHLQGLTIAILVVLGEVSKVKGTPNSMEMTEGFNGLYLVTVILLFMAPAGFVILFFHLAGKFLSMLVRPRWKDVHP